MVIIMGKDSKGWGNQVHGGFVQLEESLKNGGEEKGSGGRDGLLWRIKGTYDSNRVNPINIGTQEVSG